MKEYLINTWDELIGRQSGPLYFRLILQPLVAAFIAIWAGRNDAQQGKPVFLGAILRQPKDWRHFLWEAWRDVGTLFLVGIALDITYQLIALHGIRPGHALIVATVVGVIPYLVVRSLTNRIMS